MAAVQGAVWSNYRQVKAKRTPYAVTQLPLAALVHRSVAEQPQVGAEDCAVLAQHFPQMGRTGLFFSFKKQFQVDRQRNARLIHCIQRGKQGNDRSLVVASGAGEDSPFGVKRSVHGNRLPALFHRPVAQHRPPWV